MTDTTATTTTTPTTPATKPGYKTTEGWFTAIANLIGILYILGVVSPDGKSPVAHAVALAAMALMNAGYAVARGTTKAAATK